MFLNILVPVDFTSKNRKAFKIAKNMAIPHRARITFLHVIEKIDHLPESEARGLYKKIEKKVHRKMDALEKSLERQYHRIFQVTRIGNRAEQIVRYAANRKIDLIIMNSHRVESVGGGLGWGTTSYKVAGLSTCPVLLVK